MATKRRKLKNLWISAGVFFTFSLVLFVNNLSDLTTKFGLQVPINWITWSCLIATTLYTWYMASEDKI